MKSFQPMRAGIRVSVLLITSLLFFTMLVGAFAANKPAPPAQLPDMIVWIDTRSPGMLYASMTYPKVVPRAQAQKHLDELLKNTGWVAASVNISDSSVMESGENPMTSIELVVNGNVDLKSGVLPLVPIVKTLKDLRNFEILYLTPQTFVFRGYEDYENKYVKITLRHGNNSYVYSVKVKDSSFTTLNPPLPESKSAPKVGRSGMSRMVTALIVVLAFLAAALAFMLTTRFTSRR